MSDEVERFHSDGVIVLRGVFRDWVQPLRAGIGKLMADPSPSSPVTSPPFPGLKLEHGEPLEAPEFPLVLRT